MRKPVAISVIALVVAFVALHLIEEFNHKQDTLQYLECNKQLLLALAKNNAKFTKYIELFPETVDKCYYSPMNNKVLVFSSWHSGSAPPNDYFACEIEPKYIGKDTSVEVRLYKCSIIMEKQSFAVNQKEIDIAELNK